MPRIDDFVSEIFVILVTSREYDRIRTVPFATRDVSNQGTMYAGLRQLGTSFEAAAFRIPWYVIEHPIGHGSHPPLHALAVPKCNRA